MTKVLGIDPSSHTGVAVWGDDELSFGEIHAPKDGSHIARALSLADAILEYGQTNEVDFALIEDYAYMAKGDQVHRQVERGTLIRVTLGLHGIPYFIVNPSTLKKWITEKGNCKKDLIMKEVYKRWGIDCKTDNEADAVGLAMYGAAAIGGVHFTATQGEALDVLVKSDEWQAWAKQRPPWI